MLEFDAGVIGRELPVGLGVVGISIILPSCDFVGLFAGNAAVGLNWLAHPLLGDRVITDLIAAAAPATGLKVCRELDPTALPKAAPPRTKKWQPQHPTRGFSPPVECYDRSLKPCNPNAAIVSRQALSSNTKRPIDWPPAWVKANPPRSSRTCEHRTILAGPGPDAGGELKFCDTRAISPNQRS